MPIEDGGLGIKQIKDTVNAFTSKLWWRLCENKSLWSHYMLQIYVKDAHPATITLAPNSTNAWKRMWLIRLWPAVVPAQAAAGQTEGTQHELGVEAIDEEGGLCY